MFKDFSTEIIYRLMGRIYTYETDAVFLDIGTPQTYALANSMATTNRAPELRSLSYQHGV